MSDEQDSPISLSDDEDVIEQYKLDLQSEVIRLRTNMFGWVFRVDPCGILFGESRL